VRYLMIIYSNPVNWGHPTFLGTAEAKALPAEEREALSRQLDSLMVELHDTGEIVSISPLADPITTRTIRVRDGATLATDGPYIEAKEQMAGLFLLDCATPERAEEIASRIPEARFFAVELRPVMTAGGDEM
jgi:hypothetical protein